MFARLFSAVIIATFLHGLAFAQVDDKLMQMKVRSIGKFLDVEPEGLPNGWGKIKFGMKESAMKNFFYIDFFGPGGKLIGVDESKVNLAKVKNAEVRDVSTGMVLREKGSKPVERYEFYFTDGVLFMVKIFFNDQKSETPWELFLDELKRKWGPPGKVNEEKKEMQERNATWEKDGTHLKLIQHFGKYDIIVYDMAAVKKLTGKDHLD